MLWSAATLCFFGFFRSGEITVPSLTSFVTSKHLAWGDIAVDNVDNPQTIKMHLKKSKTDQLGKGVHQEDRLLPLLRSIFCSKEWKLFDQVVIDC